MAWTCPNCGAKNEGGLFNFCKKCGSTPTRTPATGSTARATQSQHDRQAVRDHLPQQREGIRSTWTQSGGSKPRRARGMGAFAVVVILVVIAAGAVIAVASRVDVGERIREFTQAEPATAPEFSADPATGPQTAAADVPASTGATAPDGSTGPATTAPAVAPALDVARKVDVRCASRWNGKQNARARREVVQAAGGAPTYAGVQLAQGTSGLTGVGPNLDGACVVIFGTQPDPAQPALRGGDVYAEAGPASGPRLPFVRLPTVSLTYAWNARVAKDGRILPKTAD